MSTVLIAEDNPILADVLRFNLQRGGYKVVVAKSGTEAIKQLTLNKPNILITDFQMPGASGADVCRHARLELGYTDMPIIVCSAKGIELCSSDFQHQWNIAKLVYKPFSMREIIATVDELCRTEQLVNG